MKLPVWSAASALAIGLAGAAIAQEQTINDYVRGLVGELSDPANEDLVSDIQLAELESEESFDITYDLDPEKSYFVYAACDDDCYDIDLTGVDLDKEVVDSDDEDDAVPILMILPGESGSSLTVTVEMMDCETDVCVVGVGLYEVAE